MKSIMDAENNDWNVVTDETEVVSQIACSAPMILSQCAISSTGEVAWDRSFSNLVTSGKRVYGRQDEADESLDILSDAETMRLLREAQADVASGRLIDGDDLRQMK